MTKPAFAILVIFLGAFVALFVFEGVLLIPGAILVYLFLDSLFPRRYLAVTNLGLIHVQYQGVERSTQSSHSGRPP